MSFTDISFRFWNCLGRVVFFVLNLIKINRRPKMFASKHLIGRCFLNSYCINETYGIYSISMFFRILQDLCASSGIILDGLMDEYIDEVNNIIWFRY